MHDMWENLPPRKKSRVRSPLKISLTKSLTLIHHFTRFCSNRSVYAWTYAPMQPHKIDHESIRIHPPWTPLIHHCWSSSLISNLSFNQNHDPTPPHKKSLPQSVEHEKFFHQFSHWNCPGLGRAILCLGKKHCRGSVACVFFFLFFWLGKQLPTNYPTVFFLEKMSNKTNY